MGHDDRVRVSCAALCRIQNEQGHYLLGLNRDRLTQGKRIYTPLGGALRYDDSALLEQFDAIPESATNQDLRLFIKAATLPAFKTWFNRREGRETSAFRELREELVEEFAVVSDLAPEDVTITFLHAYETRGITGRGASPGALTHYFHDIYAVTFVSPEVRAAVENAPPSSGLRWFSERQLNLEIIEDGALVDGRALVDSSQSI